MNDKILQIKDFFIQKGCPKQTVQKVLNAYALHVKKPFKKITTNNFKQRLDDYMSFYCENGLSEKDFFKVLNKYPFLIFQNISEIQKRLIELSDLSGLSKQNILKATLRHGRLLSYNPKRAISNLKEQAKMLNTDATKYIDIVLRLYPQICSILPQTIYNNVQEIAKKLNIEAQKFITAGTKQPQLFVREPKTLIENVLKTSQLFNVSSKDVTTAFLKQPSLFYLLPEYIDANAAKTAQLLECPKSEVIQAGLNFPQLFYAQPSTVFKKYRFYRQMFKHGLIRLTNEENTPENIQKYLLKNALVIMLSMDNLHLRCAYGRYLKQYTDTVDTTPLSKPKYKIIKALQNAPKLFKDRNPVAMRIIRQSNEKN